MVNSQSNRYSMFTATSKVLKDNAAKLAAVPALAEAFAEFEDLLSQISEKDKERMGKTAGRVAARDEAEDALVMATMIVSGALVAYARAQGNAQLRATAHVAESKFRIARTHEQINIARLIYDLAKANAEGLVKFGVSATMLDDFKARIDAYDNTTKDVASGVAERVGAKTAVSDLFAKTYDLVKSGLDPLMQSFRVTDPELYNDYRAARVIKDIGVRHGKNHAGEKTSVTGAPN